MKTYVVTQVVIGNDETEYPQPCRAVRAESVRDAFEQALGFEPVCDQETCFIDEDEGHWETHDIDGAGTAGRLSVVECNDDAAMCRQRLLEHIAGLDDLQVVALARNTL